MVPRPLPEMIGQRSQRFELRLEGEALALDYVRMQVVAEALSDIGVLTLIQTDAGTFIQVDGELEPAENPYATAATTGDYLKFLAAAKNVQFLDDIPAVPIMGLVHPVCKQSGGVEEGDLPG